MKWLCRCVCVKLPSSIGGEFSLPFVFGRRSAFAALMSVYPIERKSAIEITDPYVNFKLNN